MIRIYIDNQLVDISNNTDITLEMKSNLLNDISKLESNTTLTIKLPKTALNQRLLAHADRINSGSSYPYVWHTFDFFRNGVQIIKGGKCAVLSISDEIEISVIWGLMPAFTTLMESEMSLTELGYPAAYLTASYLQRADTFAYADTSTTHYFFADMDEQYVEDAPDTTWYKSMKITSSNGVDYPINDEHRGSEIGITTESFDNMGGKIFLHPVVKVRWLLDVIAVVTGVRFKWTGDEETFINSLIIPLINKKANSTSFTNGFTATLPVANEGDVGAQTITITSVPPSNIFSPTSGTTNVLLAQATGDFLFEVTSAYTINNLPVFDPYDNVVDHVRLYPLYYEIEVEDTNSNITSYVVGFNNADANGNSRTIDISERAITSMGEFKADIEGHGRISLNANDKVRFNLRIRDDMGHDYVAAMGNIKVDTAGTTDEVTAGLRYPIVPNLPDIKIIDFIKTLAVLTGTFPLQGGGNVVTFVPYSTIITNVPNAVDWSERLVPNGDTNKPHNTNFSVSQWAQSNWYKWKEDSMTPIDQNATLDIANATLDATRDVITLPFAASQGSNVPMYSWNENHDGVNYKACQPRIMRYVEGTESPDTKAHAIFDINLQDIINTKYDALQSMLDGAHLIKEYLKLDDLDILNFDETTPVYLRQYGAYFAVTKITAKSNGIAEAEMLQLNL